MDPTLLAWDMYFANLVGLQYHPANPPGDRLSLEELGRVADAMIQERAKRCRSSVSEG